MNNFESPKNIENQESKEQYISRIHLVFLRHEEKEKSKEDQSDDEVRLTEKGRRSAAESSNLDSVSQAVAYGSPKKRAQETAGFRMSGNQAEITGEETLEELKEKLDKDLKVGTKLGIDERLSFDIDFKSPYGSWLYKKFENGEYIKALLLESDKKAKELGDKEAETGSIYASRLSEIILRYVKASDRWNELVKENEDYEETLTRIFGTHAGVNEAFLGKVIEETKEVEELNKFIELIPNGFDYNEGFDLDIITTPENKKKIKISYEHKNEDGEVNFEF
ncbi:MAG: histidine phosphatase family protein, partial [Candidatus Paceibacterota bacterium]